MVSILSAARILRSKVASSSSFGQLPLRVLSHFFLPDFFNPLLLFKSNDSVMRRVLRLV